MATKMSRIRKPNVFAPSPTNYVRQALGTVGVESRTMGCWSHAVQVCSNCTDEWLSEGGWGGEGKGRGKGGGLRVAVGVRTCTYFLCQLLFFALDTRSCLQASFTEGM